MALLAATCFTVVGLEGQCAGLLCESLVTFSLLLFSLLIAEQKLVRVSYTYMAGRCRLIIVNERFFASLFRRRRAYNVWWQSLSLMMLDFLLLIYCGLTLVLSKADG